MSRFTMMYRAIKSQNMKPLVLFAISVSILVLRKPALAFSIDANSSRRVVAGVAVKRLSTSRCVIFRKKHKNNEDQLKPLPINATPSIGIIHSIDLPCENNDDTAIDDYFMGLALKQAQYAWDKGEVPIGAIIVRECNDDDNLSLNNARETIEDSPLGNNTNPNNKTQKRTFQILSKAHNQVESNMDASAHAELLALRQGAINLQNWRYPPNSKLYTTMEPCPMW